MCYFSTTRSPALSPLLMCQALSFWKISGNKKPKSTRTPIQGRKRNQPNLRMLQRMHLTQIQLQRYTFFDIKQKKLFI